MDTLPLEVLAIVVDKLAEDTTDDTPHQSLKACSLVSHSFLLCARAHLFKTVYLRKHKHKDIPITTTAASPPVSLSKLRCARAHLIDTGLLRKYKNSAVPITAAVSSPTLALVKSLTIDFSSFSSKSRKPYPSIGGTVGFPTSLADFTALENLTLMHLSWDPWTADALLQHLQTGPQIFQVLLLEAIQFPCASDLCSIVRASPRLRILSCVGVYLQSGGGCSEQHVWDHIEILGLVILHVTFRMFVRGSMENEYRLLKAILDPEQCPKALPKLRWILFLVDALADTDLFDELLEMTEGTVTETTMFFPVVPATCPQNLHISHLNVLRLELSSWEPTARPTQDAIKTLQRIRGYLEQDLKYRLKRLEMQLSQCIVLPLRRTSTSMEQAWEAFLENMASSDRFGELEEVQLNFVTAVGMKYVESRTWNSFGSLRRNGVSVTMSLIPP